MFKKKESYYHIDEKPKKKNRLKHRFFSLFLALALVGTGMYLLFLTQSPEILANEAPNDEQESALINSGENFIKIERINLLVPFHDGDSELTLESGAWHRFPERGDPEVGGNFILSAHRFQLGLTPNDTKERSPFYHIDKLQNDDNIDIFYNGEWYKYRIVKSYSVEPEATEIEAPSETAKLTLYSCTLKGSADGRVVIEAVPLDDGSNSADRTGGGAVLL